MYLFNYIIISVKGNITLRTDVCFWWIFGLPTSGTLPDFQFNTPISWYDGGSSSPIGMSQQNSTEGSLLML